MQDCLKAIEDKMDSAFARLDSWLQSLEARTVITPSNMVTFFLWLCSGCPTHLKGVQSSCVAIATLMLPLQH